MKSNPCANARLALVGVSGYARIHLDLILKAHADGLIQFHAVVVINPVEEAVVVGQLTRLGVRVYNEFEHFLHVEAGRIDLCCIPTGIALHAPMTVAALRADMNVLVEKPLAGSVLDADQIIQCEMQTGRFVAVGFQDIYTSFVRELKQDLLNGIIGQLHEIRFLGMWPRSSGYYSRNVWAGRVMVDGVAVLDSPLNNAFAHFPHLALFLAGDPFNTAAPTRLIDGDLFRAHSIDSFDTAVIRATATSGVRFWFGVTHACLLEQNPDIRIIGSTGEIVWKYDEFCRIRRHGKPDLSRPVYSAFDARAEMFRAVIQRLHDPGHFIASPAVARAHTALIEEIHAKLPIVAVDPALVSLQPDLIAGPAHSIPVIDSIEYELRRAFQDRARLYCRVPN